MSVSAPKYRTTDLLTLVIVLCEYQTITICAKALRSFTIEIESEICQPKHSSEFGEQEGPVRIPAYQRRHDCKPERTIRPPIDA